MLWWCWDYSSASASAGASVVSVWSSSVPSGSVLSGSVMVPSIVCWIRVSFARLLAVHPPAIWGLAPSALYSPSRSRPGPRWCRVAGLWGDAARPP